MQDRVNKANTFADLILKYGKIIAVIGCMVGGGFLIYNQIQYNTHMLDLHAKKFEEILHTVSREFEVQGNRSDKRYARALNEAEEIHDKNHEQDDKLWDMHGRVSFLEGKLSK